MASFALDDVAVKALPFDYQTLNFDPAIRCGYFGVTPWKSRGNAVDISGVTLWISRAIPKAKKSRIQLIQCWLSADFDLLHLENDEQNASSAPAGRLRI